MTACKPLMLAASAVFVVTAWGQSNTIEPSIGYLYPAGGRQGSVVQIMAGGQFLRRATDVYVSGEGVHASVVKYYKPFRNLDREQRLELRGRLVELTNKRLAELGRAPLPARNEVAGKGVGNPAATKTEPVELPDHPLLENLENNSLGQLRYVAEELLSFGRKQFNRQLAEKVLIEVAIDAGATPGNRELRLRNPLGLTNPLCFQVGLLPEVREQEPNDPRPYANLPEEPPVELPVLLNGQINPGDVDRFSFRARRGQQLVMEVRARSLIPYLADAVPGWFQATLALYDAKGREVAFADDYRFSPDPVLFYEIPEDGEYELEIRDSIYRGREDFVYRIAVAERPFITAMFPLGGRMGAKTITSITGWNLPGKRLRLDTEPGAGHIRRTALLQDESISNWVRYAVDTLPDGEETEPNDTTKNAQRIALPLVVNGRIAKPGDVDVFRFEGRAGDEVVAEVYGRRLHSPLDSLLRLTDASGRVLEWNDDHEDKEMGLCTHHADSYLRARLPKDGIYYVHLADSQHHGGEAYGYRLRIAPPQPDFALRVTPSSINAPAGRTVPIRVHALRKDGFDGDIQLVLKDAPAGFALRGGRIPRGRDDVRMTLTAPRQPLDQPVALQLEGRAWIDGQTLRRPVVPSEDMMQAFIYRHLAPSRELMVAVTRRRPTLPAALAGGGRVRLPAGGTAQVRIRTPRHRRLREIELELSEPPEGVTLQDVTVVPGGLAFRLKADGDGTQPGFADNLIVEAFIESPVGNRNAKKPPQQKRISLGVFPAIPFEIVRR